MNRRSSHEKRKAQAYDELRWVDLYVHPDNLRELRALAADLLLARYPFLGVRDAYRNVRAGQIVYIVAYPFHAHPDDIEYLREQGRATFASERKSWGLL